MEVEPEPAVQPVAEGSVDRKVFVARCGSLSVPFWFHAPLETERFFSFVERSCLFLCLVAAVMSGMLLSSVM